MILVSQALNINALMFCDGHLELLWVVITTTARQAANMSHKWYFPTY